MASVKIDNLTKAAYVHHAVQTTEDHYRDTLRLSWRLYRMYRLARFGSYPLSSRLRVVRVGADRDNHFRESLFSYKYDVLARYYDEYLSHEGVCASVAPDGPGPEDIRCLFSVLTEVFVKDHYKTASITHPDDRVVDIGANVGVYAIAVKERFPSARVLAFEPARETFATLQSNVAEYEGIDLVNAAVGESNSTKDLLVGHNILLNNLEDTQGSEMKTDPIRRETIKVEKLDNYVDFEADLVKLDIEGYEEQALRGAQQVIAENRPIILCAKDHASGQADRLRTTMQAIAPRYQSIELNDATMCFFLPDKHQSRIDHLSMSQETGQLTAPMRRG